MAGTFFPVWSAGQTITAAGLNDIPPIVAWKTTQLARSSVTPTADPDLVMDLIPGTYAIEAFANYTSTGGGHFRAGFSYSGTQGINNWMGIGQGTAAVTDFRGMGKSIDGTNQIWGDNGANFQGVFFNGMIEALTSGTLSFLWSIDSVGTTTLRQASWLKLTQVA